MAAHLAAREAVTVFNRTASKAEAWVARHGHRSASSPREAAAGARAVLACVGNDDDLRSVCLGPDGAVAGMAPGTLFIDHTTVSAHVTRELAVEDEPGSRTLPPSSTCSPCWLGEAAAWSGCWAGPARWAGWCASR